jgi:DNA-directed RNA polymerase specialized sigma24 family protein
MDVSKQPLGSAGQFASTHWSVVLQACDSQAPDSAMALEKLCTAYWYPLYVYVRCRGRGPEEARDLTQEFFARLLQKKWLREADPGRGRFRTFLLTAMMHFLANEWHQAQTGKRGGGQALIALDALEAEERFALEPRDNTTPAALYDRRWALTLIGRAQDRLKEEHSVTGESERFAALEPTLAGERAGEGYRALADRFAVTESTVKSWVLRLRRRFRALLLDEIAQTVGPDQDPESELKELLATLGG